MGVEQAELDAWCRRELGAGIARQVFAGGHLADVVGVRLTDGREVVLKVRLPSDRLEAIVAVQRHLHEAGFPCPQPLAGPAALGELAITAEAHVPARRRTDPPPPAESARLLADLVAHAPSPSRFPSLAPAPPWVGWDHDLPGIWPTPDDLSVDLDAGPRLDWLDEAADLVRPRLSTDDGDPIIGHADWEAHNIGWDADQAVVVYDWDSLAIRSESALAGAAAAVFASTSGTRVAARLDQSEAFLTAYAESRRPWSQRETEVAWAAGLWVLLYNGKKETRGAGGGYLRHLDAELAPRMALAGL